LEGALPCSNANLGDLLAVAAWPAAAQVESSAQAKARAEQEATAAAQAGKKSAQLASGSTFEAELAKSIDAGKVKAGDKVEARTRKDVVSEGEVIIPKKSKLLGRVTEAQARGRGEAESESRLGIVFDRAITPKGEEIPLNVVIQAVAAAESAASAAARTDDMMAPRPAAPPASGGQAGGSGNLVGTVGQTAGAAVGAVGQTAGAVGQTAGAAVDATAQTAAGATAGPAGAGLGSALGSSSSGVVGLQGLTLRSETSGESQGSLLVSNDKNVRLESGTRFLLRVEAEKQKQNEQ
jgi:hypothetical protein